MQSSSTTEEEVTLSREISECVKVYVALPDEKSKREHYYELLILLIR